MDFLASREETYGSEETGDNINCKDSEPLLNDASGHAEEKVKKYWYRWYICFTFAFFGLWQGAIWNTWSPIDESAKLVFGFTTQDIALLTNWGPISFIPMMPFYMWLMEAKGLRITIVSGALLVVIGSGLRCIPAPNHILRYLIHIGQFLNGVAGCPVMAIPALLSNTWFPPEERITATGITTMFNYMGTGVAYVAGIGLVQSPSNCSTTSNHSSGIHHQSSCKNVSVLAITNEISNLLYTEFGVAVIILIAMLCFFPAKPTLPPSLSASSSRLNFKDGLLALRLKKKFWVIALASSITAGMWGSWTGVMAVILEPLGISQENSDFIGFITTLVGCVVAMGIGWFTDRLRGQMKKAFVVAAIFNLLGFVYFTIIDGGWIKVDPFLPNPGEIWSSMMLLGITENAIVVLGMEMSADAAYPISEGTSGSVLVWLTNIFSFVLLFGLSFATDPSFANYITVGGLAVTIPLVAFGATSVNQRLQIDREAGAPNDVTADVTYVPGDSVDGSVGDRRDPFASTA